MTTAKSMEERSSSTKRTMPANGDAQNTSSSNDPFINESISNQAEDVKFILSRQNYRSKEKCRTRLRGVSDAPASTALVYQSPNEIREVQNRTSTPTHSVIYLD